MNLRSMHTALVTYNVTLPTLTKPKIIAIKFPMATVFLKLI